MSESRSRRSRATSAPLRTEPGDTAAPQGGDEGELLRRHAARLERSVAWMAPWAPRWLIEEGCGHAWEQLVRCQPERGSVFAWLRVVAYHEVLRLGCIKRGEPSLEAELAAPGGREGDSCALDRVPRLADPHDPEAALEAREALRLLAGLRFRQRRALALQVAGYSYKEICERLGVSYTWVNRHVTEGRADSDARREQRRRGRGCRRQPDERSVRQPAGVAASRPQAAASRSSIQAPTSAPGSSS